jgi:hypothetical protein
MNQRLKETIKASKTIRQAVQSDFKDTSLEERQELVKLLFDSKQLCIGTAIRTIKLKAKYNQLKSPSTKQTLREYAEHLRDNFQSEWELFRGGRNFFEIQKVVNE